MRKAMGRSFAGGTPLSCIALATAVAIAVASRSHADVVPNAPIPDTDPFYAQPDPMPDGLSGTILDSRAVTFTPFLGIPLPNPAWQLKYLSRDTFGQPIAAIATVVQPLVPSAIGPVLLSYQSAEDSLGNHCAPSHTLTGSTANGNTQAESAAYLPGLYALSWTVVVPDHEGPYSVYGVGTLEGQITLDGIRAAESFAPLGLPGSATRVAMWGYSGGALATAWAASLQPSYAPELNVVGVASGGTPADLKSAAEAFDSGLGNAFFSLGFSAVIGINRVYTDLVPDSILNDKGRAAVAALKDGCVGMTGDGSPAPTGHFADYVTIADPLNSPAALATYPKIDLPQPGRTPTAEVYVYHSQLDELIPIAGTDAMVQAWCTDGAKVHYYRGITGEHVSFAVTGGPDALLFLASRFAASPAALLPATTQSCN